MNPKGRSLVNVIVVMLLCAGSVLALAEQILIGVQPGPWHGKCDGVAWQAEASSVGILVVDRDCPTFKGRAGRGKFQLAMPIFHRPPLPVFRGCGYVRFTVYNVIGQEVFSAIAEASADTFAWDGTNSDGMRVAAGWYYWRCGERIGRTLIR